MRTVIAQSSQTLVDAHSTQRCYLDGLSKCKSPIYIFTQTGKRLKAIIIDHDDLSLWIAEMNAPTFRRLLYKVDIAFIRKIEEPTAANDVKNGKY